MDIACVPTAERITVSCMAHTRTHTSHTYAQSNSQCIILYFRLIFPEYKGNCAGTHCALFSEEGEFDAQWFFFRLFYSLAVRPYANSWYFHPIFPRLFIIWCRCCRFQLHVGNTRSRFRQKHFKHHKQLYRTTVVYL